MARKIAIIFLHDKDVTSNDLKEFLEYMPLESFGDNSFIHSVLSLGIEVLIPQSKQQEIQRKDEEEEKEKNLQFVWFNRFENWNLLGPQCSYEDINGINLSIKQVVELLSHTN